MNKTERKRRRSGDDLLSLPPMQILWTIDNVPTAPKTSGRHYQSTQVPKGHFFGGSGNQRPGSTIRRGANHHHGDINEDVKGPETKKHIRQLGLVEALMTQHKT